MLPSVKLSETQYNQIARLLDTPDDELQRLHAHAETLPQSILTALELKENLEPVLPRAKAGHLARLLISLASYCRYHNVSSIEAVGAFDRGLRFADWSSIQRQLWTEKLRPVVARLLEVEGVHIIAKAMDLAFDYANLLSSAKIISDIRPVFDDKKGEIIGAIVSQVLRLEYQSAKGRDSISIALDKSDVENLRDVCEQGLNKSAAIHRFMKEPRMVRTIDTGEEIHDFS